MPRPKKSSRACQAIWCRHANGMAGSMAPSPASDASSTRFDRLLAIRRSSYPHNSHHISVSRLGGIGPLLPGGGHGSSPLTLSANAGWDLGLCHLQTDAGPAVAARGEAVKVARYIAMLHVAFLKRGPGRARLTAAKAGRSRLLRGTLCAARLSLEEGGLQPPSYYWRLRFFRPERPQQFSCRRG